MTKKDLSEKKISELDTRKLSETDIENYLKVFDFWGLDENGHLITSFEMSDFKEALALLNMLGELAEKENHHPDLSIYDYKNVFISFCTHDAGGLTLKDFAMAAKIEHLFEENSVN